MTVDQSGIVLSGVSVFIEDFQVLWSADLTLPAHGISCVLGPNGSGKSTAINAIAGVRSCASGSITWQGRDITSLSIPERVAAGIVLIPERRRLFPSMTVQENIMLGAWMHRREPAVRERLTQVYDVFPALPSRASSQAGDLSGGQQQMVAIARGLMARPQMLMLDEPFLGVSVGVTEDIIAALRLVSDSGVGVVVIDQDVQRSLKLSQYAVLMGGGRVALAGESARIQASGELERVYLGQG